MNPSPAATHPTVPREFARSTCRARWPPGREDLVHGERFGERLLGDPALLVHALLLDQRDLSCGAAPCKAAELEKADEERPGVNRGGKCPPKEATKPRGTAA